jgi:hypothetical protein
VSRAHRRHAPPPSEGQAKKPRAPKLKPAPADVPRRHFTRGRTFPTAIAWFGLKSFWGHLWHFAASVIATEDIDSRDWMRADPEPDFTRRIADQLGARADGQSVTESLGGDVWIDYLADTGDDADVSRAVAALVFSDYEVGPRGDDPTLLPRGHILLFGGDTAYPVATDLEIHNRLTVPFNRVLRDKLDGRPRVLLGIPGNHDWYAGLDGFGRMFRERRGSVDRASRVVADDTIDPLGQIGHFIEWAEAFRFGDHVHKRPALPLEGYTTVQTASYWALLVAPGLHLWGVDRQLRNVDFRQRAYFADLRQGIEEDGVVVCMPDPPYAYLEPYPIGQRILEALDASHDDGILTLSGDTHHYSRLALGAGMHVTAGGGGAFLHPPRISRGDDVETPVAEFPGIRAARALTLRVPLYLASGRSGVLVHLALALVYLPTFLFTAPHALASFADVVSYATAALVTIPCALIGGWRQQRRVVLIFLLSALTGAAIAFLPRGLGELVWRAAGSLQSPVGDGILTAAWVLTCLPAGAFVFGTFLAALAWLGLEHNQAAGALSHPGYKHFVRLRFRRDGSAVDGWVIGLVDPLAKGEKPVLIDRFTWKNPATR